MNFINFADIFVTETKIFSTDSDYRLRLSTTDSGKFCRLHQLWSRLRRCCEIQICNTNNSIGVVAATPKCPPLVPNLTGSKFPKFAIENFSLKLSREIYIRKFADLHKANAFYVDDLKLLGEM